MSQGMQLSAAREARTFAFWSRQFSELAPPLPASLDLSRKTAVITGSNVGLGFESARHLLSRKLDRLILAVRSQSKGDEAASELRRQYPKAEIQVWIVDMASYKSISAFVERCGGLPRIDIAILNAGLVLDEFVCIGEKQRETALQVNFLSTAFLALKLIRLLRPTSQSPEPGRLTMVGSDTIYHSEKNLRDPLTKSLIGSFDEPSTFPGGFEQYVIAKFYLAWFVEKLATQVSADHVIVNMAMPGLCKGTAFIRPPHDTWYMKLALALMGKTATRGANAIVTAAVVLSKASHGGLINEGNIKPYPPFMYKKDGFNAKNKLWQEMSDEYKSVGIESISDELSIHGENKAQGTAQ